METFSVIFEIAMVIMFGLSWPFNIARAYKARTAKGTSLAFTLLILFGYICGIMSKIFAWINGGSAYWTGLKILAFVFYCINLSMLIAAVAIYFRNKRLDQKADKTIGK